MTQEIREPNKSVSRKAGSNPARSTTQTLQLILGYEQNLQCPQYSGNSKLSVCFAL